MTRDLLERWQVAVYAASIAVGVTIGLGLPAVAPLVARALWPLLATLLFVTFLQVPLADLRGAFRHRSYVGALLVGNFVAVPLLVGGLSRLLPADPSIRLGFFLVMLVPCTDWFTTFAHLGRGDGRLALASTPLLLVTQLALLPLFLWLFLGREAADGLRARPFLEAFAGIVLLPLVVAYGIEALAKRRPPVAAAVKRVAWLPVPLLGAVLFAITASEIRGVLGVLSTLARVAALFALYLLLVPLLAIGVSKAFSLTGPSARTVLFSLGTRNSFVVLPLVLAWPGAGPLAASVVVVQTLVELCGMLVYIAAVSRVSEPR